MKHTSRTKAQLIDDLADLRKLAVRHEALLNGIPHIIMEVDMNGVYTWANPAGYEFFGDDVIGKEASHYFVGKQDVYAKVEPLFRSDTKTFYAESWQRRRDGEKRLLAWWSRALRDTEGRMIGALSMAQDITEKYEYEKALKNSEARLRAITAATPTYICEIDADGKILFANRTYKELSRDKVVGADLFNWLPEGLSETISALLDKALLTGKSQYTEYTVPNPQGEMRTYSAEITPITEKGYPSRAVLTANDITERKLAAQAKLRAYREWKEIFHAIGHPTLILNPQHRIIAANRAACRLMGRAEESLRGKTCYDLFHIKCDHAPENCPFTASIQSGNSETVEMEMEALGKIFLVSCTPVFDEVGYLEKIIHISTDITRRKRMEEMQKASSERIVRQQRCVVRLATEGIQKANEFKDAARKIDEAAADALNVERASVWLLQNGGRELLCIDLYEKPLQKHSDGAIFDSERYPRYFTALKEGRAIDAHDVLKDPRTEELRNTCLLPLGITSMLVAAIRVAGDVVGAVCLEHIGEQRTWHNDELTFAGEIAGQAAQALLNDQRMEAEKALRASEEKYRLVAENIPVAVYSALPDEHSTNLFMSGRVKDLTGYTIEEFIADSELWTRILHPDDRERVWRAVKEHREAKKNLYVEYRLMTKKKGIRWIRDVATPMFDQQGDIIRIDGFMEDITERRHAEEALQQSEERFHELADLLPQAIFEIDRNGNFTYANRHTLESTGYSRDDIESSFSFVQLFQPADRSRIWRNILKTFKREPLDDHAYTIQRKDGSTYPALVYISPIIRGVEPVGLRGLVLDMSEHYQLEKERR